MSAVSKRAQIESTDTTLMALLSDVLTPMRVRRLAAAELAVDSRDLNRFTCWTFSEVGCRQLCAVSETMGISAKVDQTKNHLK